MLSNQLSLFYQVLTLIHLHSIANMCTSSTRSSIIGINDEHGALKVKNIIQRFAFLTLIRSNCFPLLHNTYIYMLVCDNDVYLYVLLLVEHIAYV